ncbi:MAG: PadR family transcriptional regulator, partial [Myxococcota bacterium]
VEYCVLELLYQHHESYGYAIMKSLEDVEALRFNESTIYLALGRLTRGGVLASRHVTAESGRKRRYFRLTSSMKTPPPKSSMAARSTTPTSLPATGLCSTGPCRSSSKRAGGC